MSEYRLFSTRQNRDGSFDTPSVDLAFKSPSAEAAVSQAVLRIDRYGDAVDVAWLIDADGAIIWSVDFRFAKAA